MKKEPDNEIYSCIVETMLEMPVGFQAGGHNFYMYPPSLGTEFLIEHTLKDSIDEEIGSSILSALSAIRRNRLLALRLIAITTFENRIDALKEHLVEQRISDIKKISTEVLIDLVLRYFSWQQRYTKLFKHYGLEKEQEYLRRCEEAKDKNEGSISFNGKSPYGTMVDVLCERYGWSMQYVLWGISVTNVQMLLADHVVSVYLSKKERSRACVPTDRRVVNMDKVTKEELLKLHLIK